MHKENENESSDMFQTCMENDPRGRRTQIAHDKLDSISDTLSCLKANGSDVQVWGSVGRKLATENSDIDLFATDTPTNHYAADKCNFMQLPHFACGLYDFYTKEENGLKIELTLKSKCEQTMQSKWNDIPQRVDPYIEDVVYCVNETKNKSTKIMHYGDKKEPIDEVLLKELKN